MRVIGRAVKRKEGILKVSGQSRYIDDITMPDMLWGVTVRSTIARGKILKIHFDPAIPWNEFVIVTAQDIPGKNVVTLLDTDQPFLAEKFVNHMDEPILLLAHPDHFMAERAKQKITIEYETFPAVLSWQEAVEKTHIVWGSDNIFKQYRILKGNPANVWDHAEFILEGEYSTGAQEQLYIENNGMIAVANPAVGVTVWGSMQCPYYIHKGLLPLFNLPAEKVRIIQTETGGGFGGKEEYPTMLAGHAALLAWKAGKPVKMIYSRQEDMAATTKRHPSHTKIKTAHDKQGKILAMEIDFTLDGGAYMTLSPVVLSRGTIHAAGPYRCENIQVTSRVVATNYPPHGAFRGFGAPQSIFAMERHLDRVAFELGISPIEIRKCNFLKKGDTTATGQLLHEEPDLSELLDKALAESQYYKKLEEYKQHNSVSMIKKGLGVATFMHGAGFTGSGEKYLASVAGVEALANGQVLVLAGSTEIGQGTNTVFSQIAAETLNTAYESVQVATPDTGNVPNSGPTVASRTTMVVGQLVANACESLKQILIGANCLTPVYTQQEFASACRLYIEKFGPLKAYSEYKQPPGIEWDDKAYKGEAYAAYAWAAYVADVSVDTRTCETEVIDFVAVQEIGRVMHPVLAEGQIQGGVAQAIGYALYEKVKYENGGVVNAQMTNYIMPTSTDVPVIRVIFEEKNQAHGAFGAKGIGELPMDGPAPAILNAIENATGIVATSIPLLPEDLFDLAEGIRTHAENVRVQGEAHV